jgi:exopolysaccharide biosynthesis polyprenyl glycosylphosphotransferase
MLSFRRKLLLNFFKICDVLILSGAFLLAAAVESYEIESISLSEFLSMRIKIQNFVIFLGLILIWHLIFSSFRLYNSRRLSSRREEAFDVLKATSLGTITLIIAAFIFRIKMASPVFLITFWGVSSALTILGRLALRSFLKQLRMRGRNLRNLVIVGTNPRAVLFARNIQARPEVGYRLLGFVDDVWTKMQEFQETGYELISTLKEFPSFLRNNVVDEVAICLPVKSYYRQSSQIAAMCAEQGILARIPPDPFNLKSGKLRAGHLEDDLIITVSNGSMEGWPLLVKRGMDITISLISLILLAPLFPALALLIKADSPGPVFFTQERVGLGKRRFRLYKFRTMVQGAEKKMAELEHLNEASGPVFKIKNDPRITRIGKILRKTSIDELPQLFNILKGDMSLVGPRPLPVRDYEGFDEDWHRRRFSVRPGITCLWQINGRSDIPFDKWMELDMEYIDSWSLWLDFQILTKTIPAALRSSGAA